MSRAASSTLPLVLYPSPLLRVTCSRAALPLDSASSSTMSSLLATAAAHDALGLAAPQVGSSLRAFVLRVPRAWTAAEARRLSPAAGARRRTRAVAPAPPSAASFVGVVNPEILERSAETVVGFEGCLSLPDAPELVRRASEVRVRFTDAGTGALVERDLGGLPAAVFQHELDHLDGVLVCDRAVAHREEELDEAGHIFNIQLRTYY